MGIGSYATTGRVQIYKVKPGQTIPGTLNVGDTFPVSLEALLFFSFVEIDALTLVLMLAELLLVFLLVLVSFVNGMLSMFVSVLVLVL